MCEGDLCVCNVCAGLVYVRAEREIFQVPQCSGTECTETGKWLGWRESSEGWLTFVGGSKLTEAGGSCTVWGGFPVSYRFAEFWTNDTNPGRTQLPLLTPLQIGMETYSIITFILLFLVFGPFTSSCHSLLQPLAVPALCRCWRGI